MSGAQDQDWHDKYWPSKQEKTFINFPRKAEQKREKRRVRKMELLMVAATVLSAGATTFTGIIANKQYDAARASLTASDRNRTFTEVLNSLKIACSLIPRVDLSPLIVSGTKTRVKNAQEVIAELYFQNSASTKGLFTGNIDQIRSSFETYKIWLPSGVDEAEIDSISHFFTLPFIAIDAPFPSYPKDGRMVRQWWVEGMMNLQRNCKVGSKVLVRWFREGRDFERTQLFFGRDSDVIPKLQESTFEWPRPKKETEAEPN